MIWNRYDTLCGIGEKITEMRTKFNISTLKKLEDGEYTEEDEDRFHDILLADLLLVSSLEEEVNKSLDVSSMVQIGLASRDWSSMETLLKKFKLEITEVTAGSDLIKAASVKTTHSPMRAIFKYNSDQITIEGALREKFKDFLEHFESTPDSSNVEEIDEVEDGGEEVEIPALDLNSEEEEVSQVAMESRTPAPSLRAPRIVTSTHYDNLVNTNNQNKNAQVRRNTVLTASASPIPRRNQDQQPASSTNRGGDHVFPRALFTNENTTRSGPRSQERMRSGGQRSNDQPSTQGSGNQPPSRHPDIVVEGGSNNNEDAETRDDRKERAQAKGIRRQIVSALTLVDQVIRDCKDMELGSSISNLSAASKQLEEANKSFNSFHPISETNEILNVLVAGVSRPIRTVFHEYAVKLQKKRNEEEGNQRKEE